MVTTPVNMGSVAIFLFVTICAILSFKQIRERIECSRAKADDIERKALRKLRMPHVNRRYKEEKTKNTIIKTL